MFNCIDGSRVDMKKIQRALSYVSIKLSKLGIQKLKGFCFATTITNDSIDIFIDDPNDEYDLDVDGNGNKFIHLDMSKYSMERRIDDLFKHLNKTFLDWPNENAKSALFGMPQLLYDENGELLDEISIGKLLVRITEAISDETGDVSKLTPGLFVKAMEVCKEIYLENNLHRYKKSNISNKYLVKRSK